MHLSGAVVSTSDYKFAGPSLIPDEDSLHTAQAAVHPPKGIPRKGKLCKLRCHSGSVSQDNGLISITGINVDCSV